MKQHAELDTLVIGGGVVGMSLAYGIVHKHHGRFELETETGLGSTFRVILPLSQALADIPPSSKET